MKKECVFLLIPVYLLATLAMLVVLVTALLHPQNNLIPWQMMVGTTFSAGAFLGVMFFWIRHEMVWKAEKLFWPLLVLFGVVLWLICYGGNGRSGTFSDYANVYQYARELANGKESSYPQYFLTYSNNLKPAIFLSVLFHVAYALGLPEFSVALIVCVAKVLLAVWALRVLLADEAGGSFGIWALALTAACLPVYVFTGAFYTDTMSFGSGLVAVALLKKAFWANKNHAIKRQVLFVVTAGLVTVFGMEWKMTALIPLLAGGCLLVVWKSWRNWKILITYGVACLAFLTVINVFCGSNELMKQSKETGNPLSSWIAIGMDGNGSWEENREFADALNALPTKNQKKQFTMQYLSENWKKALSPTHVWRKIQHNFAGGMLKSSDFLTKEPDESLLWEMHSPWGKLYWRTSQIMFCYVGCIYGIVFLGCLKTIVGLFRGEEPPQWKTLADVALLGTFLFLMLWESNNRQLYNQIPVLILGLITNGRYLLCGKEERTIEHDKETII